MKMHHWSSIQSNHYIPDVPFKTERQFQFVLIKLSLHKESYMSAHVLLNLLNELGKSDKMRGLPSILSLFRNKFNNFNNT